MAPLALDGGKTSACGARLPLCGVPRRGGRAPELDKLNTLQWTLAHPCRRHYPSTSARRWTSPAWRGSYAYLLE
ncbi:MAG: hypothetical protein M5R42_09510 [Rhodocyclaceae bacterium]|nr:hypothetical protein [Rhodocyclaceae bacterium]